MGVKSNNCFPPWKLIRSFDPLSHSPVYPSWGLIRFGFPSWLVVWSVRSFECCYYKVWWTTPSSVISPDCLLLSCCWALTCCYHPSSSPGDETGRVVWWSGISELTDGDFRGIPGIVSEGRTVVHQPRLNLLRSSLKLPAWCANRSFNGGPRDSLEWTAIAPLYMPFVVACC